MIDNEYGFCMFFDWVDSLCYLDPGDAWSVVLALKEYYVTGKNPIDSVDGPLKALVSNMYQQILRAKVKSDAGRKGAAATNSKRYSTDNVPSAERTHTERIPNAERTHTDNTETETETEIYNISPPLPPSSGGTNGQREILSLVDGAELSDKVKAKLREWLEYKGKSAYRLAGIRALITRICKAVESHGDTAVCSIIDDSMASGYKGIVWDRLDRWRGEASAADGGDFKTQEFFDLAVQRGLKEQQHEDTA